MHIPHNSHFMTIFPVNFSTTGQPSVTSVRVSGWRSPAGEAAGSVCRACSQALTSPWTGGTSGDTEVGRNCSACPCRPTATYNTDISKCRLCKIPGHPYPMYLKVRNRRVLMSVHHVGCETGDQR